MVYKEKAYSLIIDGSTSTQTREIKNNTNKNKVIIIKSVSNCATQLHQNQPFSSIPQYCEITYVGSDSVVKDFIYFSCWNNGYSFLNRRVTLKPREKIVIKFNIGSTPNRYGSVYLAYSIIEDQ